MQTVVVNQTHISFFTNAVLVGRKALTRAVTDCSSEGLEVGGDGMRLGEIVFYPRALSPSQVGLSSSLLVMLAARVPRMGLDGGGCVGGVGVHCGGVKRGQECARCGGRVELDRKEARQRARETTLGC
eukprot:1726840-Rhodomonas_salina.3